MDFLFTYYPYRPAQLERWHPGPAVVLLGDVNEYEATAGYVTDPATGGLRLDRDALPGRLVQSARSIAALLTATANRPPAYGCFGLHEWAMVYRAADRRHGTVPLRLGSAGTDEVVEALPIRCTHFDAYRFFTDEARPRNALSPTRATQVELEQPGCLHATMDLYKWASILSPVTPSDLVADCFELAVDVRELDMRASPYDLLALGYAPVPIETPAGRAAYVRAQAALTARATPLRAQLLELGRWVLDPGG